MKIMKLILLALTICFDFSFAQAPQMVEGWPHLTRTNDWPVYSLARFSNQIENQQLFVFFNNVTFEVDKFQISGQTFDSWPLIEDSTLFGNPSLIFDIDHDGKDEIVVVGDVRSGANPFYLYSLLYLIDDNTSVMPGFPIQIDHPISLTAGDMDNDGEYEIIIYSVVEGLIHCFDRYGNSKTGWPQVLPEDILDSPLRGGNAAIGDLDNDGNNEYVIGGSWHLYAFRYDGEMQLGFPTEIPDTSYTYNNNNWAPILADIDLDGYLEILATGAKIIPEYNIYNSFFAKYNHDGQMSENWPKYYYNELILHTPTPADINQDGAIEIGFQLSDRFALVNSSGDFLPGYPIVLRSPDGFARGSTSDVIFVDINGDGNCEIFMDFNAFYGDSIGHDGQWYGGYSYLFGIDIYGNSLPGFPVLVNGAYFHRPPTFEYDESSHRLYMSLVTEINKLPTFNIDTLYLEIYLFPDSTGPPNQWPMLSHDNLMTRNYNFVDNITSINDTETPLPKTCILKQNYPNPFNGSTIIEFSLPKSGKVNLSIYDILGRKVKSIENGILPAGNYNRKIDLDKMASGLYFCVLSAEKTVITRKMMLMK